MAIGDKVKKYQAQKAAQSAPEEFRVPVDVKTETADPVPPTPTGGVVNQSDFLATMQMLIAEIRNSNVPSESKERLALEAERLALEQERIKREMPENKQAPGISVYSHPEGDLKHPKAALKCKVYWIGYELNTDTLTPTEIELLNRLQPGEFRVTKTDGTGIPFRVEAKFGDRIDAATGRPELRQLAVWFPCKAADQKQNHGTMTQYLQQVLGDRVPTAEELQVELAKLRAELALASA